MEECGAAGGAATHPCMPLQTVEHALRFATLEGFSKCSSQLFTSIGSGKLLCSISTIKEDVETLVIHVFTRKHAADHKHHCVVVNGRHFASWQMH
jgi:hypothetical protein